MKKDKLFLKKFKIYKLFGTYNVDIDFKSNVNIFVGENGLGKTTILNMLNYVLQGDSEGLSTIDFKEIELVLGNDEIIKIDHDSIIQNEFDEYDMFKNQYISNYSKRKIGNIEKKFFLDLMKMDSDELESISGKNSDKFLSYMNKKYGYNLSPFSIERMYAMYIKDNSLQNEMKKYWEFKIFQYMKEWGNIIYLPTYRRIEEDFNNLIGSRDNHEYYKNRPLRKNFNYLQFGMDDVQNLIDDTCNELRNNTNDGFKGMTSNILTNYINIANGKNVFKKNTRIVLDKIDIIFSRLADEIDVKTKQQIFDLLTSDSINYKDREYIISILNELMSIYKKNQQIDDNLERFRDVCNEYLVNNKIEYDQIKIKCFVKPQFSDKTISLKNLSSGEKQIISLFSKLYLSKNESNVILFDEPELSLSILWQRKLLPDILDSERCGFIIAITHSPFIFDNDLAKYAIDIESYIKPVEMN